MGRHHGDPGPSQAELRLRAELDRTRRELQKLKKEPPHAAAAAEAAPAVEEIATPARFVGRSLAELALPDRYGSTVLAVRKAGGREVLVGPGADYVVTAEDLLVVLAPNEALQKLQQL